MHLLQIYTTGSANMGAVSQSYDWDGLSISLDLYISQDVQILYWFIE